jgi:hypothetical protein
LCNFGEESDDDIKILALIVVPRCNIGKKNR